METASELLQAKKPRLLISIPCFNEELILRQNMSKILGFAEANLAEYDWKVQIIDNASSDATFQIAQELSKQSPKVILAQCQIPGRGAALTRVWKNTPGHNIYSYMDIDLATDLKDFPTLLSSIRAGDHIAVGSRYSIGADIQRNPKREFLSRVYNGLLKLFFNVNFKDAQCGFKAFQGETLPGLLAMVKDAGWFWDTEIMIHAQNKGYTIREIPVSWQERRDEIRASKVEPFKEVVKQLKNIAALKIKLIKSKNQPIYQNENIRSDI